MNHNFLFRIVKSTLLVFGIVFGTAAYAQVAGTDPLAENMLVYQRSYGGWPKAIGSEKVDYSKPLTDAQRKFVQATSGQDDATIDNKATTREIVYLVKAYSETKNTRYIEAAKKGIDYLLKAQYENGGWPQYYPNKKFYRAQVTFNDDAMINVLNILMDVSRQSGGYAVLGQDYAMKARMAVEKGVICIIRTQQAIDGKLTSWAAQYDEITLQPAKARAFELPALASSESVNIVRFLMRIEKPSAAVQQAITSAVEWFERVKISGYRADRIETDDEAGKDQILVADTASTIWARFYDLKTMQPLFVGRDGVPKTRLADIDQERRGGYAWYGVWGAKLPKEFAKWKKLNGIG